MKKPPTKDNVVPHTPAAIKTAIRIANLYAEMRTYEYHGKWSLANRVKEELNTLTSQWMPPEGVVSGE